MSLTSFHKEKGRGGVSLRRNPYDVATGELPPPQGEYGVEFSSPEAYLSCRDDPRPKSDGPSRSGRDPPPLGPRAGEHRHIPDPAPVFDVLNAFRKSQVLFASVQLGVYDALAAAQAPCCVEDVLTRLSEQLSEPAAGVSLDGLSRLLNANVAIGFVLCADGRNYSLAAVASEFLTTASPRSLAGYALHAANVVWPLFGNLAASVRSGGDAWQETFGLDARDCFGHLYRTPEDLRRFLCGMHSLARLSAPPVLSAFDLSRYTTMVDLGGATGAFATAACQAHPTTLLSTTVVDLPHVIEQARAHFRGPPHVSAATADAAALERVAWLDADFFAEPDKLPQADLYLLSRILHDWPDEVCVRLLQTVKSKLTPSGGAVLIAEMLLDDDGTGPAPALLQSLNMLVQTHGRERTNAEYQALLAAAGFNASAARFVRTGSYLDAILVEWSDH